MKKPTGTLFALALVTIATLGSSNVYAQDTADGFWVRIAHMDSWNQIPIDVTVKKFTILTPWNILNEGPFVGRAEVAFTGEAASYFEPGVDRYALSLTSDTVLFPGTRLHLQPLDRRFISPCVDLAYPTQEPCYISQTFFQSVLVTNKKQALF